MLSKNLEITIHDALSVASQYHHEYATYEHLLISLLRDNDMEPLLKYHNIDVGKIHKKLHHYLAHDLSELINETTRDVKPTAGFQRIIQRAAIHCEANGISEVNGIYVLAEFFFERQSYAVSCLKEIMITRHDVLQYAHKIKYLQESNEQIHFNAGIDRKTNEGQVRRGDNSYEDDYSDLPKSGRSNHAQKIAPASNQQSALETYCVDLNHKAKGGIIDCLVGRQNEIQRTIEILCRRRKNNALLVGEPGVGKTAIAEGLALRIINNDVPDILKDAKIYALDIGGMVAGTKYRGDFEERIKKILTELKERDDAILFIDEIHTIIGAGSTTSGSLDASNLLKPAFAKGEIRCIGSTTFKEYHNHFEKDMALVRRFQKVVIVEPDEAATVKILHGLKGYYESHHKVKYDDSALLAAVVLSERYINDRNLPDKAIDLMDEAGARKKVQGNKIKSNLITTKDIEELVALIANIPNLSVEAGDVKQLQRLEKNLKENIFGQDEAIAELCSSIKLSRAGLKSHLKPTGCYLFTGATGVGKTELAKQLAKFGHMELIKFDMSEYSEHHSVSRLLGSPPGYVGFDQGGLLTEEVDKYPYSVVLFDEIEKAHPEIYNLLLQIMDEGKLTDTTGKVVNFAHTIIILTSNIGVHESKKAPIGFGGAGNREVNTSSIEAVHRVFSPEFCSRLDKIIVFNPLSKNIVNMIVDKILKVLAKQLEEKKVKIHIDDQVKSYLTESCSKREAGARALERFVESEVKQKIADEILFGKLKKGGVVTVMLKDEKQITFKFLASQKTKESNALEFSEEIS
jgi:ATP-dependent Clp protease ATP-binding subunit ClpA